MAATQRRTAGGGRSGGQVAGAAAVAWTPRRVADELLVFLDQLGAAYDAILRSLDSHAAALAAADAGAVGKCVADQEELLGHVSRLDSRRREIVAGACVCVPVLAEKARSGTLTVTMVAGAMPLEDRGPLVDASERVKNRIERTRARSEAVRIGTVTMLAHVEGLMRHVGRKLSHAGTYGRRGVVEAGQQVISALDMKT